MVPPESILLSGSNAQEILRAYDKAIAHLAPDVRRQLAAVAKTSGLKRATRSWKRSPTRSSPRA
jgi:hypothetical protein